MYIDLDLSESDSDTSLSFSSSANSNIANINRTIIAPEIDLSDSSYNFYIWGKSSESSVAPKKVSFSAIDEGMGTIPIDFPISTYCFTLAVTSETPSSLTDSSEILRKAVLVAYSSADLSYSTTVQFHLSAIGLKTYGDMNLSFCLDDSWTDDEIADLNENWNVRVGLFEVDTGDAVSSFPSVALSGLGKTVPLSLDTYSAIAGTYNLVVSMKKNGGTASYTYSDTLIVAPNRVITETVYIPNVIEYAPAAPSDFKAAYCTDERIYYDTIALSDGVSASISADPSSENEYALLLSWRDNSVSESNFKVTLVAVSKMGTMPEIPAVMTDADWTRITNGYLGNKAVVTVYDENCIYEDSYFAGSLSKNSTSLILYVPFDVCYIAKIEAVNDAGISAACYATVNSDFNVNVYDTNYGNNTAVYSGKAFSTVYNPCNVINLYKVVYNLSGGALMWYKDGLLQQNEGPLLEYAVYGSYSFICPFSDVSAATEDSPSLVYIYTGDDASAAYNSRWTHWKLNSVSGTNLIDASVGGTTVTVDSSYSYQKPNNYTGYKSLYLCACYD
ncbi:MAG: hypothetical protein K6B43_01650 [Treponema sp.]|nr:hypothetical protein [Treponema sp.]